MTGFASKSPCEPLQKPKEGTLPEFLLSRAAHWIEKGHSKYLIDGLSNEFRSYESFEDEGKRVASHFYNLGLRKGDIVIYMTCYQVDLVPLMMGVWRANGVVRSLYPDECEETILQKLVESESKWIFCDADIVEKCQAVAKMAPWPINVVVCGPPVKGCKSIKEFYEDNGISCPKLDINENDIALVLPTSGTTGPSKGAMHPHKTIIHHIRLWSQFQWSLEKPNVIASKGTHISGAILPWAIFNKGTLGVVLPKVNKEILIQTVDKYKPGVAFAFPSFLLALGTIDAKGYDISSIHTILTGGSPVTPEMKKAYLSLPNVDTVYIAFGLTEGPCVSTNGDFRENAPAKTYTDEPGACTVGRPYPGGEIQIRDLETREVLGPNERGEVYAKGDYLFSGYFKNKEATEQVFIGDWFQTGDVGYLDQEGYLFIVDRAKDIFKYFHNHISPTELENVVSQHPEVKEACVFPILDEGGEVPRAFVTLKNPNGKSKAHLAEEIKIFADGKLATYKQLKGGLFIVDDFPKGKTGKVVRTIVAQMDLPTY